MDLKQLNQWFLTTSVKTSTYRYFWGNPGHPNLNIASNPYRAKIWCIFLQQQNEGPWISFTNTTELKSSFTFKFWMIFFRLW